MSTTADVATRLELAITGIRGILEGQMSQLWFEELYSAVYHIVLDKQAHSLYQAVVTTVRSHLNAVLDFLVKCEDSCLLESVIQHLVQYESSCGTIRDVTLYMDRAMLSGRVTGPGQQALAGKPLFDLLLELFMTDVLLSERLSLRVRRRIDMAVDEHWKQDSPDSVPRDFKSFLRSMSRLGYDQVLYQAFVSGHVQRLGNEIDRVFAVKLLDSAASTFQALTRLKSVVDCHRALTSDLQLSENIMARFEECIQRYIHASNAAIESISVYLVGECTRYKETLTPELESVLSVVFPILRRDSAWMTKFVTDVGRRVAGVMEEFGASTSSNRPADCEAKLNEFLHLVRWYESTFDQCFPGDAQIASSIRRASAGVASVSATMSAIIPVCIDQHIRTAWNSDVNRQEVVLQSWLKEDLSIALCFAKDADTLAERHRVQLSNRLVAVACLAHGGSLQRVLLLEKCVLAHLKPHIGGELTHKCEAILSDLGRALQSSLQVRERVDEGYSRSSGTGTLLSACVFAQGLWPASVAGADQCFRSIPACLGKVTASFTKIYGHQFPDRRIRWSWSSGAVELRDASTGCTYQCSLVQGLILHHMGCKSEIRFSDIISALEPLGVPVWEIERSLVSMSVRDNMKLVRFDEGVPRDSSGVPRLPSDTLVFLANDLPVPRGARVRLPLLASAHFLEPIATPGQPGASQVSDSLVSSLVDDDRRILMEAVLVRIMKKAKQMTHNNLLATALEDPQLRRQFLATPVHVVNAVSALIRREYLRVIAHSGPSSASGAPEMVMSPENNDSDPFLSYAYIP